MTRFSLTLMASVAMSLPLFSAYAQTHPIPLTAEALDLTDARDVEFKELGGRDALCFSGYVGIKNMTGRQGQLRADAYNSGQRQFANLAFHAEDSHNHEAVYLRLHKSGLEDSFQYTPHINNESNWQLFAHSQDMINFGTKSWIGLGVVFEEDHAEFQVTVDGSVHSTALPDLALNGEGEGLGLRSLLGACFSNISVDLSAPNLPRPERQDVEVQGQIPEWGLSQVVPHDGFSLDVDRIDGNWTTVQSEPNGTVLISRHRQKISSGNFLDNELDRVQAGLVIVSDRDRLVEMNFDVSDMGRVLLNDTPILIQNNSFRAKNGRGLFRGDFDISAQSLILDLKAGENVLLIDIAELANGWGFGAKIENQDGLTIRPYLP